MKIFTERGFQEELNRRREEVERMQYEDRRFNRLEEQIAGIYKEIEDIKRKMQEGQDG